MLYTYIYILHGVTTTKNSSSSTTNSPTSPTSTRSLSNPTKYDAKLGTPIKEIKAKIDKNEISNINQYIIKPQESSIVLKEEDIKNAFIELLSSKINGNNTYYNLLINPLYHNNIVGKVGDWTILIDHTFKKNQSTNNNQPTENNQETTLTKAINKFYKAINVAIRANTTSSIADILNDLRIVLLSNFKFDDLSDINQAYNQKDPKALINSPKQMTKTNIIKLIEQSDFKIKSPLTADNFGKTTKDIKFIYTTSETNKAASNISIADKKTALITLLSTKINKHNNQDNILLNPLCHSDIIKDESYNINTIDKTKLINAAKEFYKNIGVSMQVLDTDLISRILEDVRYIIHLNYDMDIESIVDINKEYHKNDQKYTNNKSLINGSNEMNKDNVTKLINRANHKVSQMWLCSAIKYDNTKIDNQMSSFKKSEINDKDLKNINKDLNNTNSAQLLSQIYDDFSKYNDLYYNTIKQNFQYLIDEYAMITDDKKNKPNIESITSITNYFNVTNNSTFDENGNIKDILPLFEEIFKKLNQEKLKQLQDILFKLGVVNTPSLTRDNTFKLTNIEESINEIAQAQEKDPIKIFNSITCGKADDKGKPQYKLNNMITISSKGLVEMQSLLKHDFYLSNMVKYDNELVNNVMNTHNKLTQQNTSNYTINQNIMQLYKNTGFIKSQYQECTRKNLQYIINEYSILYPDIKKPEIKFLDKETCTKIATYINAIYTKNPASSIINQDFFQYDDNDMLINISSKDQAQLFDDLYIAKKEILLNQLKGLNIRPPLTETGFNIDNNDTAQNINNQLNKMLKDQNILTNAKQLQLLQRHVFVRSSNNGYTYNWNKNSISSEDLMMIKQLKSPQELENEKQQQQVPKLLKKIGDNAKKHFDNISKLLESIKSYINKSIKEKNKDTKAQKESSPVNKPEPSNFAKYNDLYNNFSDIMNNSIKTDNINNFKESIRKICNTINDMMLLLPETNETIKASKEELINKNTNIIGLYDQINQENIENKSEEIGIQHTNYKNDVEKYVNKLKPLYETKNIEYTQDLKKITTKIYQVIIAINPNIDADKLKTVISDITQKIINSTYGYREMLTEFRKIKLLILYPDLCEDIEQLNQISSTNETSDKYIQTYNSVAKNYMIFTKCNQLEAKYEYANHKLNETNPSNSEKRGHLTLFGLFAYISSRLLSFYNINKAEGKQYYHNKDEQNYKHWYKIINNELDKIIEPNLYLNTIIDYQDEALKKQIDQMAFNDLTKNISERELIIDRNAISTSSSSTLDTKTLDNIKNRITNIYNKQDLRIKSYKGFLTYILQEYGELAILQNINDSCPFINDNTNLDNQLTKNIIEYINKIDTKQTLIKSQFFIYDANKNVIGMHNQDILMRNLQQYKQKMLQEQLKVLNIQSENLNDIQKELNDIATYQKQIKITLYKQHYVINNKSIEKLQDIMYDWSIEASELTKIMKLVNPKLYDAQIKCQKEIESTSTSIINNLYIIKQILSLLDVNNNVVNEYEKMFASIYTYKTNNQDLESILNKLSIMLFDPIKQSQPYSNHTQCIGLSVIDNQSKSKFIEDIEKYHKIQDINKKDISDNTITQINTINNNIKSYKDTYIQALNNMQNIIGMIKKYVLQDDKIEDKKVFTKLQTTNNDLYESIYTQLTNTNQQQDIQYNYNEITRIIYRYILDNIFKDFDTSIIPKIQEQCNFISNNDQNISESLDVLIDIMKSIPTLPDLDTDTNNEKKLENNRQTIKLLFDNVVKNANDDIKQYWENIINMFITYDMDNILKNNKSPKFSQQILDIYKNIEQHDDQLLIPNKNNNTNNDKIQTILNKEKINIVYKWWHKTINTLPELIKNIPNDSSSLTGNIIPLSLCGALSIYGTHAYQENQSKKGYRKGFVQKQKRYRKELVKKSIRKLK